MRAAGSLSMPPLHGGRREVRHRLPGQPLGHNLDQVRLARLRGLAVLELGEDVLEGRGGRAAKAGGEPIGGSLFCEHQIPLR